MAATVKATYRDHRHTGMSISKMMGTECSRQNIRNAYKRFVTKTLRSRDGETL